MIDVNKEKPAHLFKRKLFWLGVVGTYILAGIMFSTLHSHARYEELMAALEEGSRGW